MASSDWHERYRQALDQWLDCEDACAAPDLGAIGRAAIAAGCGFIDALSLHQTLVASRVASSAAADIRRTLARADGFLRAGSVLFAAARDSAWNGLERRLAERTRALEVSEQRFDAVTGITGSWTWLTDREHRFIEVSGTATASGVPKERLLGRTRWEVAEADPATDENWARHLVDLEAHRPFSGFEYTVNRGPKLRLHIAASGVPSFDDGGMFLGYRGASTNVSVLQDAIARAEQAEAMLRDAIESISGGFLICDADDNIVLSNGFIRRDRPGLADALDRGVSYEEFTRASAALGYYPDAAGREEAFVAERLAAHRAGEGASEIRIGEDNWQLVKHRRMRDGGTVTIGVDITDLKRAQAALATSEARLDRAQEIAAIGSWEEHLPTGSLFWSKEMYRIHGKTWVPGAITPEMAQRSVAHEDPQQVIDWFDDLKRGVTRAPIESTIQLADGGTRVVRFEGRPIPDASGTVVSISGTLQDVTRRRLLQRQLVQAQKMEAIGGLTGGMAHDFNNLLGVIIGNIDLLRELAKGRPEIDELAKDALDAALRGAELTKHLLAFARRQPLNPARIDANELIADTVRLLRRTLSETIDTRLELAPDLWPVIVDPAQLEATIANLATNARDAMPKGGRITIATRNTALDEDYAAGHVDVEPGDYVVIEFSDTGTGMTQEVMTRIFEPFFTTKEQGKGTGLGLAMVFGFLRQSGGHVGVYSEPGVGTTFRLYLPRDRGQAAPALRERDSRPTMSRGETILVVEDNEKLRVIAVKQLQELGYRVLAAEAAQQALAILAEAERVDLLLTDIVMPGEMTGDDLARAAAAKRPGLKVVLTSGFPQARLGANAPDIAGYRFLGKPYRRDELARLVRETLDDPDSLPVADMVVKG
ncbi:MAG TPA: ATP-binding protein [Stellaceae bacterium]|nr:ATP-binding protein [Stellaceae bacterium]